MSDQPIPEQEAADDLTVPELTAPHEGNGEFIEPSLEEDALVVELPQIDLPDDPAEAVPVLLAALGTAQAEAVLARARTELEIAERELEWATVLAPRDGVVMRLEAEPGDMVGHGEKGIVALYDPERLRAMLDDVGRRLQVRAR